MSLDKLLLASRKDVTVNPIGDLAEQLSQVTASRSMSDAKLGALAISTESLDSQDGQLVINAAKSMESAIMSIAQDLNIAVEAHHVAAATVAGVMATSPRQVLATKLRNPNTEASVISAPVVDGFNERPISLEAYDERENRNAQMHSIIYNLLASRQDEFGESFFPTIMVNAAEVGLVISVKLFYVYNDFKRSVTGALANYGRVNVIRAYADADVLKNEMTRAIPVLRTGGGADDNSDKFAPATEVPTWSVEIGGGITVQTSAIKVDQRIDVLGISQTNELLNSGLMGPSDALDAYAKLKTVYLRVTDGTDTDVVPVSVDHLPGALFTYSVQGNSRRMVLNLDSDGLVLDETTRNADGSALKVLTELATHKARIQISLAGSVVLDKAEAIVNRGSVGLSTLRNLAGQLVTGATADALRAKLDTVEVAYVTYEMFRANSNIRQRGQLLDNQTTYQVVQVPYRSPISVIAPVMGVNQEDTSAVQSLVTVTGIRISNDAVTSLQRAAANLRGYKSVALPNGELPELSDLGHYYVKPTFFHEEINLEATVDSRVSHERLKDIRSSLVEKIRFYANEMYRSSEYQAAALVLTGNLGFKPTVVVGTDPVIANYLNSDGELRTLGEQFDIKVVSTMDSRVKGKIYISFGVFDSNRNTSVNPLNSGNMLYASELVSNLSVARDGQTSNETMVTPRYLHIWNLPVMTELTVTGLPAVINKVAVHTKTV